MGRLGSRLAAGCLIGSVATAIGCGSDQVAPPKGLKAVRTSESVDTSKTVYMVIPGPPGVDVETWCMVAQREAGDEKAIFRLVGPGPGDPPSKQAEAIRKAMGEGLDALLVLAADAPETAGAIEEALARKVAVVLIGRAPADSPGKPPYPRIVPPSFEPSSRQVVEAILADSTAGGGKAGDVGAVVLANRAADPFSAERASALKAAAEAAGLRNVATVAHDDTPDAAAVALREAIKSAPEAVAILVDSDAGMGGALKARFELKDKKPTLFVGGYVALRGPLQTRGLESTSAYVEFRADQMAKQGVMAAVALANGEADAVPPGLKPKFYRGENKPPGDPGGITHRGTGFEVSPPAAEKSDAPGGPDPKARTTPRPETP